MQVSGYQLSVTEPTERPALVDKLRRENWFVLDTCQRLEAFGCGVPDVDPARIVERWTASESFARLVRIATGLESRVLGELEVLGQVRAAYKCFHERTNGSLMDLDRMFQDILALARKARKKSGIDSHITSLSGLAARELLSCVEVGDPLVVIGSGTLAESVVRYLGKRGNSPIRVAGRCPDKAMSLALKAGGFGASLNDLDHLLEGARGIVTATAAPHPVLYPHHLESVVLPITVIDLGEPPDCCETLKDAEGVEYLDLLAIESKSETNWQGREAAAQTAEQVIQDGVILWSNNLA